MQVSGSSYPCRTDEIRLFPVFAGLARRKSGHARRSRVDRWRVRRQDFMRNGRRSVQLCCFCRLLSFRLALPTGFWLSGGRHTKSEIRIRCRCLSPLGSPFCFRVLTLQDLERSAEFRTPSSPLEDARSQWPARAFEVWTSFG